jgi:hypothetical protein
VTAPTCSLGKWAIFRQTRRLSASPAYRANRMLARVSPPPETNPASSLPRRQTKEKSADGPKDPAAASGSASKDDTPPPPILLSLGADDCSLILSRLSARELTRLRTTCSAARVIVDALPIWSEMVLEMNLTNKFNVSPFDSKPFVWLPEAERDEDYDERFGAFKGFALEDPRIMASFATLKPFTQCSEVYAFLRKSVERIQRHIPATFAISGYTRACPVPGCEPSCPANPSEEVAKLFEDIIRTRDEYQDGTIRNNEYAEANVCYKAFFKFARLNTAMEDLRNDAGPRWYRDNGKTSRVVIEEARVPSLISAIRRFYGYDEDRGEIDPDFRRGGDMWGRWGEEIHLNRLVNKTAASDKLRLFLGKIPCERIEVLGQARSSMWSLWSKDDLQVYGGQKAKEKYLDMMCSRQ